MKRSPLLTTALILVLAALACSIPGMTGDDTGVVETQVALGIQQTSVANQQMTLAAPTFPPPAETYTPYPTYTSAPADAAVIPTSTPVDMRARIKASNILIYEDIVGYTSLLPIVSSTINMMNFSGGKIVNTGDALGTFKDHANSATKWDLMIVAAESRISFSGEMFEMMYDHINNGGAVII
ncbi:MAG: hypothetical protein Q7J80_17595, partial [Anaerolineales bacterium]|nr:hypothetical protein [Anaerolineales bacterium]